MAKQGGLGDHLLVAGRLIGGDVQQLGNVGGGPAVLDFTDITQEAMARGGGVRDGNIEYSAFFNPAEGRAHEHLSSLPTSHQLLTYLRGVGVGRPAACLVGKQVNYDGNRGDDGGFLFQTQAPSAAYGLEWCEQLTAGMQTDTEPTDGGTVDLLVGPWEFGLQAYLHVSALEGADATVTVQHSADGIAWNDVTGATFTEVTTAPGWERLETARDLSIERYVRAVSAGSFTSLSYAVVVNRNPVETRF